MKYAIILFYIFVALTLGILVGKFVSIPVLDEDIDTPDVVTMRVVDILPAQQISHTNGAIKTVVITVAKDRHGDVWHIYEYAEGVGVPKLNTKIRVSVTPTTPGRIGEMTIIK